LPSSISISQAVGGAMTISSEDTEAIIEEEEEEAEEEVENILQGFGVMLTSTLKKRRAKMNKHKLKKRRKKARRKSPKNSLS
jgi:hypothetical protein